MRPLTLLKLEIFKNFACLARVKCISIHVYKQQLPHAVDNLNATQMQNMDNLVPCAVIAFQFLFMIPVSVAIGEH